MIMKSQKKTSKKIGQEFERKVQKTINSGQLWLDKGDLKTEDYLIECKTTEKKSYRITTKLLQKLWNEAFEANKLPMLIIGLKDENCKWMLKVEINRGGIV